MLTNITDNLFQVFTIFIFLFLGLYYPASPFKVNDQMYSKLLKRKMLIFFSLKKPDLLSTEMF